MEGTRLFINLSNNTNAQLATSVSDIVLTLIKKDILYIPLCVCVCVNL